MISRNRASGQAVLGAALFVLMACGGRAPELEPEERLTYEVKPAIVRVNAYATARFSYPADELKEIATVIAREVPGTSVRRLSGAPTEEVEAGAGASGSGFVINPSGFIVTTASVAGAVENREATERVVVRNGALAALVRHFADGPLRQLAKDGKLEPLIDRLARAGRLDGLSWVEDVELANGERYGFERRRAPASAADLDVAIVRVRRRNLPVVRVGSSAPVRVDDAVWASGFPSVTTSRSEAGRALWAFQDADLEASMNAGAITAVGSDPKGRPRFLSNAAFVRGNEGGPVISRGDGAVIGFVSGGADASSTIVPIDAVKPIVEESGVSFDDGGDFQNAWRAALDKVERGRYEEAEGDLAFAGQLFPNYPDLIRLVAEADRRREERGSGPLSVVVIGLLSFAVLLLGGIAIYFAMRARSPGSYAPPAIPPITRETFVAPTSRDGKDRVPPAPRDGLLGKLTILSGDRAGERIGLGGSGIRVGREASMCEIVLDNPKVSRLHAEFVEMNGRVLLIDRNSSNGTYVNDQKIDKRFLEDGDIIYFGGRNAIAVAFNG